MEIWKASGAEDWLRDTLEQKGAAYRETLVVRMRVVESPWLMTKILVFLMAKGGDVKSRGVVADLALDLALAELRKRSASSDMDVQYARSSAAIANR
jgi:hypothetical protein